MKTPFDIETINVRGHQTIVLRFDRVMPGGGHDRGALQVGPPLDKNDAPYYRDPLGVAILHLLAMCEELKQENDALAKQRDELIAAAAAKLEPVRRR